MRGLWGNMAKEAVQCELELNNAASNLTAAESPLWVFGFLAARARSTLNAANA
jgi:hypothetical protein